MKASEHLTVVIKLGAGIPRIDSSSVDSLLPRNELYRG